MQIDAKSIENLLIISILHDYSGFFQKERQPSKDIKI
jgi:hypothetical protein